MSRIGVWQKRDDDIDGYIEERGYEYEMIARLDAESAKGGHPSGINPKTIPFAAALGHRSILDLERDVDGYGKEIFVESCNEHTGKPIVWYHRDSSKKYQRGVRTLVGINYEVLGRSHYIREMRF